MATIAIFLGPMLHAIIAIIWPRGAKTFINSLNGIIGEIAAQFLIQSPTAPPHTYPEFMNFSMTHGTRYSKRTRIPNLNGKYLKRPI